MQAKGIYSQRRWSGTLLTDRNSAYDTVLDVRVYLDRRAAACVAHARRKFDELAKAGVSPLPTQRNSRIEELLPHRWQPTRPGEPISR